MELVDFLRARYDEDAARQQGTSGQWHGRGCESLPDVLYPDRETGACDCGVPARVLAEVEAKRATIADYEKALRKRDGLEPNTAGYRHWDNRAFGLYLALRHAVAVYADYPGYAEALAAEEAALLADE